MLEADTQVVVDKGAADELGREIDTGKGQVDRLRHGLAAVAGHEGWRVTLGQQCEFAQGHHLCDLSAG